MKTEAEWAEETKRLLRAEMTRRGHSYKALAERLAGIGVQDTAVNLRNKVARGRFSAVFLIQCLSAMGARTLRIEENQDAQYRDEIATAASGSDDRAIMHLTEQREAGAVSEYVAEELAEEVFRAMMAARPRSPSLPKSELEEDARRTCEGA